MRKRKPISLQRLIVFHCLAFLKELVQESEFIPAACQLILRKRPVAELHSLAPGVCGDRAVELAEEDSKLEAELDSAAIKTKQRYMSVNCLKSYLFCFYDHLKGIV